MNKNNFKKFFGNFSKNFFFGKKKQKNGKKKRCIWYVFDSKTQDIVYFWL